MILSQKWPFLSENKFWSLASTKKEQFLKAVEKSESSPKQKSSPPTQTTNKRESRESAYAPIDSSESELYEYDASDPLDENPKIGLLYFTERDIRMEKKLIKKVAAEIEENGVGGVKPMLTKKLTSLEKEPIRIGIIGDSMSGKSTLIKVKVWEFWIEKVIFEKMYHYVAKWTVFGHNFCKKKTKYF